MSNSRGPLKINLNHLPVFVAIAETKSMTDAGRLLGFEKTRISRILAELESDLEMKLVYRTTRDLHLTEAGRLLYGRCKKILADLEEATNQVASADGEMSGHICMTAAHGVASALLPLAVKEFNRLHPRVTFDLRMTQQNLNLVREGVDIAMRVGSLEDSSYKVKKIGEISFTFAATPTFLNSNRHVRGLDDLASARMLTLPSFNDKVLVFKNASAESRIKLNSAIICNSPDLLLALALQDLGIGFLPALICRDHFKTGQLVRLFENWQTNSVPVSLLFRASGRKATPVSLFISFLSSYFGDLLRTPDGMARHSIS